MDRTDRPRRLGRYPITTAVLFGIVGSFPLFLASAYAVRIQEDLAATKSQFGLAAGAYFAAASFGAFQLGRLVDRKGTRFGGMTASIGGAGSCLIIGLLAQHWVILAVGLAITGFSNTAGQLAGNRIVAYSVGETRQGLGFGAKQASVPFGSFLAGAVVAALGIDIPWRGTFVAAAIVLVILAFFAPEYGAAEPSEEKGRGGVGADAPSLVALALAGLLFGATGNALAVLVADAFETAGFSASVAASVLAVGGGAAVVGRVGVGWVVDKRSTDGYNELAAMVAAGVVGFAILGIAGDSTPLLLIGVVLGFAAGWGWPAIIYLVTARNSTAEPATSTGFVLTGVFFGAIIGPPLLAAIAERVSYPAAWLTAAVMAALGIGGIFVSRSLSIVKKTEGEYA